METAATIGLQGLGLASGWPHEGLGALQDTALGLSPATPPHPEGPGEKAGIHSHRTPHQEDHYKADLVKQDF